MRRARPDDAPALAALHARAFDTPWSARALTGFMGDAGALTLIEGEPPQGFILIRVMAGEAEVLTLAVDPAERRAGVGRMLVEAAAAKAVSLGAASLFLEVAEDNIAALALYRAAGFAEIGRRREYYRRPGATTMDALVLKRALGANASQRGDDA
jgi:ribosomal-protein-alanine N-acetyltransferase